MPQALSDFHAALQFCLGKNYGELITPNPRCQIDTANAFLQHFRQTSKGFVTRFVSERVIDTLELVDIDQHEAERMAVSGGARYLASELAFEAPPVCQAS